MGLGKFERGIFNELKLKFIHVCINNIFLVKLYGYSEIRNQYDKEINKKF